MGRTATLLLAALLVCAPVAGQEEAAPGFDYDWVFFYYMSYDNNLEAYARVILDQLGRGVRSKRVAVVCATDLRDEKGMKRYVFTKGKEEVTASPEEGSAEEETLARELAWTGANLRARKYAIVFLDHGGRLGEMSQDEHPAKKDGQHWLYPPEVAEVLVKWRKSVSGELALLYLQQCGRGSLANLHAFRDAAPFVMASQARIGAPNYYYATAIAYAGEHPEIDGKALAAKIAEAESPNMFVTLTTFDSAKLAELPKRLDAALAPLLARGDDLAPIAPDPGFTPCFDREDERFFDGLTLLEKLYDANGLDRAPLSAFTAWVGEELVVGHRVSPLRRATAGMWGGFSLLFPEKPTALVRWADYPLYRASNLDEVLKLAIP